MIRQEDVYKIGVLGKPHGVKGEIQFRFTDDVFDQCDSDYLILDMEGILVPFFMEEYRFRSDEVALMKFCDIDSEQRAREFTGIEVYFPRAIAEENKEDLSWAQIIGFTLLDSKTQKVVGEIMSVDETTINLLFDVKTQNGEEILIPANEELITNVDAEQRNIEVDIPNGLLEL
ncbi:ribosome maturation factor RimM [Prevotella disiens]|jgi:16S rRNA processing protein rimM|uniref:Ribosome maturation factor RimM n=4 Tax=Prevotella disiens TaxID=28130 RepID=A0A379E1K6_9BACT|nr:ribosome maturation factor RimM [Prevotella disiens]EFL45903.1 16S rRNA processing protein RimM [Prevotella disiens FB035-09AN]ERJ78562.1 16S rRNA processing protein RimM [Prevotella disiens JCM 6334 = ATCC 29426]KGF48397.1 16S rRNA processing protein RimM [Prevotella disiens DNF00882]RGL06731.1 16S rRNA processing protein RimM [Prevotella disiens]SUB86162.1 16S rRNA-processing protein RimM [Prevotella disiens]